MKKIFIILTLCISLLGFSVPSHAEITVARRIKVGLKYGSSASYSFDITTSEGFTIRTGGVKNLPIANVDTTSITVTAFNNGEKNSYIVVEQSGFIDLNDALIYCRNNNSECVPFYKNGIFYAIRTNLYSENDAQYALSVAKNKNSSAYILPPSDKIVEIVNNKTGADLLIFSEENGEILGITSIDDTTVTLKNGGTHRDIIEFERRGTTLNAVSNLTMQHYLYSVVAEEIGASSPMEALKAQAVCARTYAQKNINKHSSSGFNICSSTHCQVYGGIKNETPEVIQAVDDTKLQVLTYNGSLIDAVYFSHSGGRTSDVEDVWGTPYGYLKSVDDPYCTDSSWTYNLDFEKLTDKLSGYGLGTITDFEITKKSPSGTVCEVTVTGTNGSKKITGESIRTVFGLNSQFFDYKITPYTTYALTSTGKKSVNVHAILTGTGTSVITNEFYIKSADGINPIHLTRGNILIGKGYGHCVGFSQHGAMGYAKAGYDYKSILKHYYTGTEIEGI